MNYDREAYMRQQDAEHEMIRMRVPENSVFATGSKDFLKAGNSGRRFMVHPNPLADRCTEIADQVVPQYRSGTGYSCTGIYAKRWQAAWDAAMIALGGDPAEYRG